MARLGTLLEDDPHGEVEVPGSGGLCFEPAEAHVVTLYHLSTEDLAPWHGLMTWEALLDGEPSGSVGFDPTAGTVRVHALCESIRSGEVVGGSTR